MASSSETDMSFPHPTPVPHPPSPNTHPTVIIVFISFGCLALFGAFLACIWWFWFMKRHKERKLIREKKDIDVDEHIKVQEMIVPGTCGPKKVLVSVEDDVRVHEDIHKDEVDMAGKSLHREHKDGHGVAKALENAGGSSMGRVATTSSSQTLTLPERQV